VRPALQVHGSVARGVFAVAILISLAVLFAPARDVPYAPVGVDKFVHASLFAALALTGLWAGVRRMALVPALVIYGAASEVIQSLIGRDAAVGDWLADVAGTLLGVLVWQWLGRRADHRPDGLA
jgi:hypothetical protein